MIIKKLKGNEEKSISNLNTNGEKQENYGENYIYDKK